MDIELIEERFEKYYPFTAFLFMIFLPFIGGSASQIREGLLGISLSFVAVPMALLGIYAITEIGASVRNQYSEIRDQGDKQIALLRKNQDKIENTKDLLDIDNKIIQIRTHIYGHQDSRYLIFILRSFSALVLTLAISFVRLEEIMDIYTWVFMYITFTYSIYYSFRAFFDILTGMEFF